MEPVRVYVPVWVLLAKPMILPVIVKPCAPVVAVELPISMARCAAPVVQILVVV